MGKAYNASKGAPGPKDGFDSFNSFIAALSQVCNGAQEGSQGCPVHRPSISELLTNIQQTIYTQSCVDM